MEKERRLEGGRKWEGERGGRVKMGMRWKNRRQKRERDEVCATLIHGVFPLQWSMVAFLQHLIPTSLL